MAESLYYRYGCTYVDRLQNCTTLKETVVRRRSRILWSESHHSAAVVVVGVQVYPAPSRVISSILLFLHDEDGASRLLSKTVVTTYQTVRCHDPEINYLKHHV